MDEEFFFGVEEYDYYTRAWNAGYRVVFCPTSKVWHKGGASYAKVKDYPETYKLIRKTGGRNYYKHFYYLFKKYLTPGLFFIPFIFLILRFEFPISDFISMLARGDWQSIKKGIKKRFFN
jgi:GT2 family glycosyltransferase